MVGRATSRQLYGVSRTVGQRRVRHVSVAAAMSRRAFRGFLFSPAVILDYMAVTTPGLFREAGYSDAEVDELMPTIDRIIGEEWAARPGLP